jgi:hypothetical protein
VDQGAHLEHQVLEGWNPRGCGLPVRWFSVKMILSGGSFFWFYKSKNGGSMELEPPPKLLQIILYFHMYFQGGMKNDSLGILGTRFPKLVQLSRFSGSLLLLSCISGILIIAMLSFIPNIPQLSYFSPDGMDDVARPVDAVNMNFQRGVGHFKVGSNDETYPLLRSLSSTSASRAASRHFPKILPNGR